MKRRTFLGTMGAAAGTVGACGIAGLGAVPAQASTAPVERWVSSVCGQCPGACGIRVRVLRGKVQRIVGNPFHPVNRGGLCPNGLAGAAVLHDPDRYRQPLKKADGEWVPAGWDEVLGEVAGRLKRIRQEGRAHTVVALVGDARGTLIEVFSRFLRSFGSPNLIDAGTFPAMPTAPEAAIMTGVASGHVFDLERAGFVLCLGGPIFEATRSPAEVGLAWGRLRSRKDRRTRLVYAGPRLGVTAAKADEWIQTRPGTEGTLALGIAHMIVRENLYDSSFVEKHCEGFVDWTDAAGQARTGFRSMILRQYPPSRVGDITGIEPEVIVRLARQFAAGKPPVAIGPQGRGPGSLPLFDRMAIFALNALVGSIDVPGGWLTGFPPPAPKMPAYALDAVGEASLREPSLAAPDPRRYPVAQPSLAGVVDALLTGKPYSVQAVLLYQADPVFELPGGEELARALAQVPLVVSFDSTPTETSDLARYVLPNHTYLERLEDVPHTTVEGFPVIGLRQPAVSPLHDTRHTGNVLLQLASLVGGPVAAALPFGSFEEAVKTGLESITEAGRGDVVGKRAEQEWTRLLERSGWRAPSYQGFEEFWEMLRDRGGWWDPIYDHGQHHRIFRSPSGKLELLPDSLKRNAAYQELRAADGDKALMPHTRLPVEGNHEEFPLRLVVFAPPNLNRGDPNVAWLQDTADFQLGEAWRCWAEVNPATAAGNGIEDRELVRVRSSRGEIRCRVRVHPGVRPGVVAVPAGFGRRAGGRWAEAGQPGVGALLVRERDEATGEPLWNTTRVRLEKA